MKSFRGKLRFGLRALLLFMTATALIVAWQVENYRERRRVVRDIKDAGGSYGVRIEGPTWLRKLVKNDRYFYSPVRVTLGSPQKNRLAADKLNRLLTDCITLPELSTLHLVNCEVDERGLEIISRMSNVVVVRLVDCVVREDGLVHLRRMPKLLKIELGGSGVSPEAIDSLRKLLSGRSVEISAR